MKKYIFTLLLICGFWTATKAQSTAPFGQRQCSTYYYDMDRDGYGGTTIYTGTDPVTPQFAELNKLVCSSGDCDDTNPQINPDSHWAVLVDGDGDNFYIVESVETACVPTNPNAVLIGETAVLTNFAGWQLDCDDANGALTLAKPYYEDIDNDGFGDIDSVILSCTNTPPSGYVENAGDNCPDTFGEYSGCPDVTVVSTIDQNRNYVHSIAYQQAISLLELANVEDKDKIEQVTYFDGMGRAQMQIGIGQSPTDKRDIKTIISYDSYGRGNTQFLPYVSTQKGGGFFSPTTGGSLSATSVDKEIKYQQRFYHNKYRDEVASFVPNNGGLTLLNNLESIPQELLDDIASDTPANGLLYPSYSTNVYDEIDRVVQTAAPGKDWSLEFNHTIKMEYDLNDQTADAVKWYNVTHPVGDPEGIQLVANGLYPSELLYKTVTKDENWQPNQAYPTDHTTEEFKNKSGQVLLKRTYNGINTLDTYYVYDDFGNLTYVLPPMASAQADIFANDVINKFCYQYKYDHRNRLIEKRIPGKDWEYIVYDTLDRPVLTQDVNLRNDALWLFTKYDALGRVVYTGKYTSTDSRSNLQTTVSQSGDLYESKTTISTQIGDTQVFYSNNAFPSASLEVLTVNYYDDYQWDTQNSFEANYSLNTQSGLTTTGNTISKPILATTGWNAGFTTQGKILNDGYIQYTVTSTDKRVMVGLSAINSAEDDHYNTIDYAIYTGYGDLQRVYIYTEGVFISSGINTFAVGDTFKVERSGNQIFFKKNDEIFHTIITDYTGTLIGDASFFDPETAIENVFIGYSVMGQAFAQNVKGLATGSKVRTLDTNSWTVSESYYNEKGETVHTTSNNQYLDTKDAVSSRLDFTGKVLESRTTHVKNKATPIVTVDTYVYDETSRLLYQTKQINGGSEELIARNHYDELGQLTKKQVGGALSSTNTYKHVSPTITLTGNIIEKNTDDVAWDAGLITDTSIQGDGYVSFSPTEISSYVMVGLSDDTTGIDSFTSIDYGIYILWNNIYIYESGSSRGLKGSYILGDVLKVERRGNKIYYLKNGEIFYISTVVDPGNPLVGDVGIYSGHGKVQDVVLVDLEKELQEVDYTYNVRGWLKGINDVNNQGDDLFSFAIKYNDIADETKQLFNGNISSTLWATKGTDSSVKDYVYEYDPLNRIISGIDDTGNYNLDEVEYDMNGNIRRLQRSGHTNEVATVFGVMDQLVYEYSGNQLQKVTDAVSIDYGFKDGNTVGNDYTYDTNGNMISDKNKGITNIDYNHLNLPTQITFANGSTISYIYDATGVKLEKEVSDVQYAGATYTYYAGNYIYKKENSQGQQDVVLTFFNTEEGYVEPIYEQATTTSTFGTFTYTVLSDFEYTYQYKDHLGNIRLSYQDMNEDGIIDATTEIKEENHYYPFGLKHEGYNNQITGRDHEFGFQEQEEQDDLGLGWIQFKWRNHDPAIARFMSVDPIAEDYYYNSTYAFAENKVIANYELEGLEAELAIHGYRSKSPTAASKKTDSAENNAFHNRALTYSRSNGATVVGVSNGKQFLSAMADATSREGSIQSIAVFSHGSRDGIGLNRSNGFYVDDPSRPVGGGSNVATMMDLVNSIESGDIAFEDNAMIILGGCNNCQVGGSTENLAEAITNQTGVTTIGSDGRVSPEIIDGKETGILVSDYGFTKTEKVYDVSISNSKGAVIFQGTYNTQNEANKAYFNGESGNTRQVTSRIQQTKLGKKIDPKQL